MPAKASSFATLACVLALNVFVSLPAAGQQIAFTPAGFSLSVPAGYRIQALPEGLSRDASSLIVTLNGLSYVHCNIRFHKPSLFQFATSPNLQMIVQSPDNVQRLQVAFADEYEIRSADPVMYDSVPGVALIGDVRLPRSRLSMLPRQRELKVVLANVQGYAEAACATDDSDFDRRRPAFETIIRGISFPQ
ncbi:MAG TPA: hypothetical protein VMH84_16095 [Xanthobacteraceae bacterium]|nr:hypothetical protein [Xanthobacteraceae bacterium]